ncbi:glycosyl transferase, family 2 [hydrothermal vent metagenome]|uniref:Glycosyl transferase, family 2 n=1 Tax=hydrothermal vent metagenome TaxID=652676 RepID=A0A3B1DS81_9ZZZZ
MKISVVIPTFNRANFLKQTICSILKQSVQVDEIIVIDDGSTDNTELICNSIKHIKYIYQDNRGVSSARNHGIRISSNNWIAFCDSDDIWHKDKIKKQILFHKNNPNILISHADETWIFNQKIIKKKRYQLKPHGYCFEENISYCKIGTSTIMINKSIFDDIGLFDENLTACEDYDLWLRILQKYELGLCEEELITKIAGHKGQLSFETSLMDRYRIQALLKHKNSKHQIKIKKELIKKLNIIIKGAKKHNNSRIQKKYEIELENIKTTWH